MRTSFAKSRSMRPVTRLSDTMPSLVIERPKVPKVPFSSPMGAALGVTGAVLIADALYGLFGSSEQKPLDTIFRLFRIVAGGGLVIWVAASSGKK